MTLEEGQVCWAVDPTSAHHERPVVVLYLDRHPFSSINCTVMCLGTSGSNYEQKTPELTDEHIEGITFSKQTYLLPWAIHTIAPGGFKQHRKGQLTPEGKKQVQRALLLAADW